MKNLIKTSLFILTLTTLVVSCSHHAPQERGIAGKEGPSCWDSVKTEYHSYFDSVEKCIEKESLK
jgi:carbonic anhydrase